MKILEYTKPGFEQKLNRLCQSLGTTQDVASVVTNVIQAIQEKGDKAALDYTEQFDGVRLRAKDLKVDAADLENSVQSLSAPNKKAIREAIRCVSFFHRKTLPKSWRAKNPHGATVGENFYPIQRVGVYVPGGQVPLVSSVIMSTVLAKIAGVPEIVVCTPPQKDGTIDSGLLAALHLCGVTEVYKLGGVQAIASMAHGTKTIRAVDKVFGPGNAYVMEAKRQLFGIVGVDLLPGPSEVMVIGDATANPQYLAADILAQAEHGTGKEKVYLSVTSLKQAEQVKEAIAQQLPTLSHETAIRKVLKTKFYCFVCPKLVQAVEVANRLAPEHLELQVDKSAEQMLLKEITTAGAVLLGHTTPTVLGDFTAGPSHTLPTDRTGRFSSGMQVTDFMRRSSVVRYDSKSAKKAWPVVSAFSHLEQLDAHGRSLGIRVEE